MIEARELTKRCGDTTAVHSLSFTIAPGTVTGFLGPNGAGKSTTMRMIMGLDRPTSGTVTVNGKPYRQHRAPLREVGALLEASAVHPGRSARSHRVASDKQVVSSSTLSVLSLIGETWIYYILGSVVEVILLLVIARTAWTWPRRSATAPGRSPLTAPEPWRTRVTHVRPQIEPSYLERDKQDELN